MRLLQLSSSNELTLTKNLKQVDIPPYAILSHTWADDNNEVTFEDILGNSGKEKSGYRKILFCGRQARIDNLEYFWVDSCCIDRTNSTELNESIVSMYDWYRNAKICYVYLADVSIPELEHGEIPQASLQLALQKSRWFLRGWTLQELLAPAKVIFFDQHNSRLGDKEELKKLVSTITGISETALRGDALRDFMVSERYEWARKRQTTRQEDWAYSLQGIFGVSVLPQYGEGRASAIHRLIKEVKDIHLEIGIQSVMIGKTTIDKPVLNGRN